MKDYIKEITLIFKLYTQMIENNHGKIPAEVLEFFKSQLESHPAFLMAKTKPKLFDKRAKKELFFAARSLLKAAHQELGFMLVEKEHEISSAFTNLLHSVLTGTDTQVLFKDAPDDTSFVEERLMQKEYWVGPGDPEHVPLSEKFSELTFEQRSILGKFSSNELKLQFLSALPWSTKLDNISKLEKAETLSNPDLLGYEHPIGLKTQKLAIQLLLLAIDIIGKLAGHDGANVLKNYPAIDSVIAVMEKLQKNLEDVEYSQSTTFTEQLEEMVTNLKHQNAQLYQRAKQKSRGIVTQNESINNFCHLNEILMHILLGQPRSESVLSPDEPSNPHREIIKVSLDKNPEAKRILTQHIQSKDGPAPAA